MVALTQAVKFRFNLPSNTPLWQDGQKELHPMVGQEGGEAGEGDSQAENPRQVQHDTHERCLLLVPSLYPHTGLHFKKLLGGLCDLVLQLVLNSSYLYHVGLNTCVLVTTSNCYFLLMMAVLITTNLLFHQLSVPEDVHKYKSYLKLIITRILKERAATGSMAW